MIKIYHKTATIKAEQFDGSKEMCEKYCIEYVGPSYIFPFSIETLDGWLGMNVSDWIATDVDGQHRPIADNIFQKTYVELPVIPKSWADTIEEYKANHYRLEKIFDTCIWNYDEQELIARAWLDGYQVEAQHDTRTD